MNDITALMATMKAAAEKASNDDWVKESGDGWEATCSANDQANGGFIIAHFEGPDAAENREFVQAASPANVKTLVEALEKAQRANAAQDDHINQQQDRIDQLEKGHQEAAKQINSWRRLAKQNIDEREKDISELEAARQRIAELESRTVTVKLPAACADDEYFNDGVFQPMRYERDVERALRAAGIQVIEGEGQ